MSRFTFCAIRNNATDVYTQLFNLHNQMHGGRPVTERQLTDVMRTASNFIACGSCNLLIERLDNTVFVAKCGHCYHKAACWSSAGSTCGICPPPPRT
jgi:hypothetical protein